ncbi:PP2C family protein-serine/threonine phosphatase [Pseudomonas sp. NA-150]|uniref:PP2C family protein-serine/threonine phosphatase n=1 Tax=Pseudomonas sp. NA-150 TaxID=3367525 RepID=UPI0037C59E78
MEVNQHWLSAARTDIGKVRARNEDAFLDCPQHGLWAVADGMGGYQCGDIASQMIVNSLSDLTPEGSFVERVIALRQCLHWLNRRMAEELTLSEDRDRGIMGSTVVALLVEGNRGACVWAGDSRCYLLREQQLYQLSRDHSLFEQLMSEQNMTAEEAKRVRNPRALTRAIGANNQLRLEIIEFEVCPSDVYLLCSDGLYQDLSNQALGGAMSQDSPQEVIQQLFDDVLLGSAKDNLTAVVISQ